MGLEYQITNAAHKYGLDNMAVTPALIEIQNSVIGTDIHTTNSWGTGSILVGQYGVITTTYSGGFTEKIGITYTDQTHGIISALEISRTDTKEILLSASGSVSFTAATFGTAMQLQNAFSGADHVSGNAFNNVLQAYGGNDRIEGGGGVDTVVFTGLSSQYTVAQQGTAITTSGPDGNDTLLNISRLQFDDTTIAYDLNGNAGQIYRLYQAAFDRQPDSSGLGFWISVMDGGNPLSLVANGFINSKEFSSLYGGTDPTADVFVTKLYNNVLHRAPEQGGYDFWVDALHHGASRIEVLTQFSESTENQAQIIGAIQHGISYTPFHS